MNCDCDYIEVLNRRWCVRAYADGGCGAYETRRSASSPWRREPESDVGRALRSIFGPVPAQREFADFANWTKGVGR